MFSAFPRGSSISLALVKLVEQKDVTAARMKFHAVIIAIVVQILNVKMTFESYVGLSDVLYYC